MRKKSKARSGEGRETQLNAIRDLMLSASQRGAWLTLGEIAQLTEIGEASISAQLRHLRKRRYGRHCVEKRVRPARRATGRAHWESSTSKRPRESAGPTIWEYRVLPAAEKETFTRGPACEAPQAQEDCFDAVSLQQNSGEVSDAEARN